MEYDRVKRTGWNRIINRYIFYSSWFFSSKEVDYDSKDTRVGFNLYFDDEEGNVLTHISFVYPDDGVYINNQGYEISDEQKYLLYSYIADALYLSTYDRE